MAKEKQYEFTMGILKLPEYRNIGIVEKWWRELDSNQRRLSRQIYSLIPLAAREPLQCNGADNSKLRI